MDFLVRAEEGSGAEPEPHSHSEVVCGGFNSSCRLQDANACLHPGGAEGEEHSADLTILIFPFLALFIGTLAQPLSRAINLSYTLLLLLIGILLGVLGCAFDLGLLSISLCQWVHLNPPTIFFYVFLAPLIFEAAFNTRWHVFRRLLVPILTAAFVIVIIQVFLIAAFQLYVIRTENSDEPGNEWNWWAALMFGSMLSATDPISVTATLKSLGASELLNTLIEGESLLNDGSAFVLWEAFFENTIAEKGEELSVGEIVADIFRLSVGGAAMGVAFGLVALLIISYVYDEFEVETTTTIIVAFLGFWTAQSPSRLSGVICNVASGLVLSAFGRKLITTAVRGPLAEFWELLGWIANTIVFVHAGVLLSAFIWSCAGEPNKWYDYVFIGVYYLYLQVIRIVLMLLFLPVMRWRNAWFGWKQALVVGFSGLRGAVSLVLALEVAGTNAIGDVVGSRVVLWTTGIVGLTLLVNGLLVKPLLHLLKLDRTEKTREDFLHRARALMVQRTLYILDGLCIETMFKSARWSYVFENVLNEEWLEHTSHGESYRDGVEHVLDNRRATARFSLDAVKKDAREIKEYADMTKRLSVEYGTLSVPTTPIMNVRASFGQEKYDYVGDLSRYKARNPKSPNIPMSPGSPEARNFYEDPTEGAQGPIPPLFLDEPISVGDKPSAFQKRIPSAMAPSTRGPSIEGTYHRRTLDRDVELYGTRKDKQPRTQKSIHSEIAALHRHGTTHYEGQLTDQDLEVRRRLLTAILSHVRALSNSSFVEFSVMHNLEEDCQQALDANDEAKPYDLFGFLDQSGRDSQFRLYERFVYLIEGKALRGETAITTAFIVLGIMAEILKEDVLEESEIVRAQAQKLYLGAAAVLNRLETMNSHAFQTVKSHFAIYVCEQKQDDVLHDLVNSGIVDEQEYSTLHEELVEVRRKFLQRRRSMGFGRRGTFPQPLAPRQILAKHPLFAGLSPQQRGKRVDRFGELVHLKGGQAIKAEKGSLVLVLEGMIRPAGEHVLPEPVAAQIHKTTTDVDAKAALGPGAGDIVRESGENVWNTAPAENNPQDSKKETNAAHGHHGFTTLAAGGEMHWCFPRYNLFCGPVVTLMSHGEGSDGEECAIVKDRAIDTDFVACEIAGKATIFTLPVDQVRALARESIEFRMELTRSLARQIVLESVSDQRPYTLSHFTEPGTMSNDVATVIGRGMRVLERLPYMQVIALRCGVSSVHVQGPGVLLNGTVRVSVVDSSGLVGAINLLHEQLTGPALLPAGGLVLEEAHKEGRPDEFKDDFIDPSIALGTTTQSETARGADGIESISNTAERKKGAAAQKSRKAAPPILAHVLVEEVGVTETGVDRTALRRLLRWTADKELVDMNGRFAMNRHIELTALTQVTTQR